MWPHDSTSCVSESSTHHFVCPDGRLCFELRAIPYLQRTRTAAGEKVGNLLPGEVLLFLEVDEQLVVLGRELELGTARSRCWLRHPFLADDIGRSVGLDR